MTRGGRRRAFTLVELLVVIGIIALLIAMLLPALGAARRSAREVKSLTGLRDMMLGYAMYHQEHRGAVMFGYPPSTVNGRPLTVDDPATGLTFGYPVSDRYPWRLLKYVGNVWEIVNSHGDVPPAPERTDPPSVAFMKAYTLSINPTYGINVVYVGGQQGPIYQGFAGPNGDSPNTGKHVVFRATEVKRPTELIVFADCKALNAGGAGQSGLHYLTPPRANGQNWRVVNGQIESLRPGMVQGIPRGWYSARVMVAFFDGHVEAKLPGDLEDMRLWANRADRADYDFVP